MLTYPRSNGVIGCEKQSQVPQKKNKAHLRVCQFPTDIPFLKEFQYEKTNTKRLKKHVLINILYEEYNVY